ncbi:MAG: hypothetical protein IKA56_06135 [Clostridia bacterium]|nr:hypothetical protein [Clostridia bacterium]
MKRVKKISATVISLLLVFALTFSASASLGVENNTGYVSENIIVKSFFNIVDRLMDIALDYITDFMVTPPSWESGEVPEGFMAGTETFTKEADKNGKWLLGYDSRSLLPENKEDIIGKLFVAGTIAFDDKTATSVVDDLKVRTFALNDNSGTGTAVFAVVDSYGLALGDVREIRMRLADFAKANNINSITVSVLHQHSAVDTFGMNGNIAKMVLLNPIKVWQGMETENGKNDEYMESLYETCVASIKEAVGNMTEGDMFVGTADASEYIYDKRQPYVTDPNFTRFRFVPDNGEKETWIVTSAIHCTGNGAAGTDITGDYPYYAEEVINAKADANVAFVLGAELCVTQERNENTVVDYREDMTRLEATAGFGRSIGNALTEIEGEKKVAPLLNIRYKETKVEIDNGVLLLAGKAGVFENIIVSENGRYSVLTEVGYMELGEDMAFAIIPGELAPELAYGGTLSAQYAWSGEEWAYPSLAEIVEDSGRELYVLGLANDQIGYILPGNDYMPMLYEESQSIEFVSLGENTAATIVNAFESVATAE